MTDDELRDKLIIDLQARIRLDNLERATWYNGSEVIFKNERDANAYRLGVEINDIGVAVDFNNKIKELEKANEGRIKSNDARHKQIDSDIIAGRLDHVWIDARMESVYFDAKKVWQLEVDEAERYKRFPSDDVYNRFVKTYGENVTQQLVKDTIRDFEKNQREQDKLQQEKEERAKAFQAEEKQRLATEAAQKLADQHKREQQQTAYRVERKTEQFNVHNGQVTIDRRSPVNDELEADKIQRKIDRAEIERLKSKLINPLDKAGEQFNQHIDQEKQNQAAVEEQERQNTLKRIERETEAARQKAERNPVDATTDSYEEILKSIQKRRERYKGQGW